MSQDSKATESDGELPAGWSKELSGGWGRPENEIRLGVHYSKVTFRYTAVAKSGEFFLSCSLLGDLQTALAEAGRLGELLRLRLGSSPRAEGAAQSGDGAAQSADGAVQSANGAVL